jgi:methyl-accepting chemotaxis protein WspA
MQAQTQSAAQISEAMVQLSETQEQTAIALSDSNRAIDALNEGARALQREFSRFSVGA